MKKELKLFIKSNATAIIVFVCILAAAVILHYTAIDIINDNQFG